MQHVLRYLRAQGIGIVPEPRGVDSADREVLAYIEGRDQGAPFIPEFPRPPGRLARLNAFACGTGLAVTEVLDAALQAQEEYARRIIARHVEPWTTFQRLGLHENAAANGAWTRIHFRDELCGLLANPFMSQG